MLFLRAPLALVRPRRLADVLLSALYKRAQFGRASLCLTNIFSAVDVAHNCWRRHRARREHAQGHSYQAWCGRQKKEGGVSCTAVGLNAILAGSEQHAGGNNHNQQQTSGPESGWPEADLWSGSNVTTYA